MARARPHRHLLSDEYRLVVGVVIAMTAATCIGLTTAMILQGP